MNAKALTKALGGRWHGLRLIEAWRPHPTYLITARIRPMTEQELESLRTVINYLWRDEQKNFEECAINDGGPPDDHIFSHLETLDRYLTREQADDVPPEQASNVSPFI